MDKDTANRILSTLNDSSFVVDNALSEVKGTCPDEPFRVCARLLGTVMSDTFDSVMAPIYDEHPDLAPEWYREGAPRGRPEIPALKLAPATQRALLEAFDSAYEKVQSLLSGIDGDPREVAMMRQGLHQISVALCRAQFTLLSAELEAGELR